MHRYFNSDHPPQPGWFYVVVLTVSFGLLIALGDGKSQAAAPADFCKRDLVLKDHLALLADLPQHRGFRDSGRLRVGPSVLRVYPPRENLVRVGQDGFESQGSLEASARSSRPLDWWVESRLERVDRTGLHAKLVKAKWQHIATVGKFERRRFGFPASVAPGIYRLTVEIQNADGVKLDRYEEYYRAVKTRTDLRLSASFTTLAAGETGYLRIDNLGTVPAGYGFGYRVWNVQGEEVPVKDVRFSNILLGLKPGYAGLCSTFKAPEDLAPGRYRIGVDVMPSPSERFTGLYRWVEITSPVG